MKLVMGIDVAKEESEVQAFLEKGQTYGKSFSIKRHRGTSIKIPQPSKTCGYLVKTSRPK